MFFIALNSKIKTILLQNVWNCSWFINTCSYNRVRWYCDFFIFYFFIFLLFRFLRPLKVVPGARAPLAPPPRYATALPPPSPTITPVSVTLPQKSLRCFYMYFTGQQNIEQDNYVSDGEKNDNFLLDSLTPFYYVFLFCAWWLRYTWLHA